MFLIVLGIIVFIVVGVVIRNNPVAAKFAGAGRIVALLMIVLGILTACIKQVDAGEVGVKILFGSIQNDILGSGLHLVNPLLTVTKLDVKTQNYTMSGIHDQNC